MSPGEGYSGELNYDVFMDVKGIKGESTDSEHKDWIEVLGFQWSVRQPSGTGGASATLERADFSDFTVLKQTDRSSPQLCSYCARGSEVPEIRIELVTSTGTRHVFATYTLKRAIVSQVKLLDSLKGVDAAHSLEEVSFRYGEIKWEYTPVSHDGSAGATGQASFDLEANRPG